MDVQAHQPLKRWHKIGLGVFVVFLLAFGGVVEKRSAFLTRRMGDLDVFLRAAWAVRVGADLYAVTSDNDWHYLYPPLYAILFVPLADPPPGTPTAGYVPYAWSVAICYLLSLAWLFWGAHMLASALEERTADPPFPAVPRYCRRWWALRLWPILICWLPIGHTLSRGQVNLMVLGVLCAALAGWLRGQNFRAGLWLALAICVKVIPAFLLVYPLWKRDARGLLGGSVGLCAGLVLIPVLVFGPYRAAAHYETYGRVFFGPLFKLNHDTSREEEILGGVNATESIGVKNAIFNWMYPQTDQRPRDMPAVGQALYLTLGVLMTFLTLWPLTRRRAGTGERCAGHSCAALILLMAIFSPVCHSHYLAFCMPVVMCLLSAHWRFAAVVRSSWLLYSALAVFVGTIAIAYLPGMEILKDRCAALFATLPLWILAVVPLWRRPEDATASTHAGDVREVRSAA